MIPIGGFFNAFTNYTTKCGTASGSKSSKLCLPLDAKPIDLAYHNQ
jgi:hypothetical protein